LASQSCDKMAPDVLGELRSPSLEEIFEDRAEAQDQVQSSLSLAADCAKWYFDLHKQEVNFKMGDKVWLKGSDLRVKGRTKLSAKNYSLYKKIKQLGPVDFKLKLPQTMKVHPVFHASKLLPFHLDEIAERNPPQPEGIEIEGQIEFVVEKVLDSRVVNTGWHKKMEYLVKWLGYDDSENTWEPPSRLKNSGELVREFHNEHHKLPNQLQWTMHALLQEFLNDELVLHRAQALKRG
jgi:hypothetical protein